MFSDYIVVFLFIFSNVTVFDVRCINYCINLAISATVLTYFYVLLALQSLRRGRA